MATIDITRNMVPSEDADQWITADQYSSSRLTAGDWIELRMRCRYTRRTERFSVLYQGPGGSMRIKHGGPKVTGPLGSLIAQASIIANTPVARARYIDVRAGDVLVINGQRLVILDDQPHDYPRLVSEVEAGLIAAANTISQRAMDDFNNRPERPSDDDIESQLNYAKWAARQELLNELRGDVLDLADTYRQTFAAPAKR